MSTITTTNNITGTMDDDDKLTAKWLIAKENERRTALNNAVPPPDPLWPMLPSAVAAERKASCEAILNSFEAGTWASWTNEAKKEEADTVTVKNIREAAIKATPAQRNAALTALTT